MKKETLTKSLIVLSAICIMIIISIIIIYFIKIDDDEYVIPEMGDGEEEIYVERYNNVNDEFISQADYMNIRKGVQNYINVIDMENIMYYEYDQNRGYVFMATEEEISKNVYNLLSTEFIKKNNIKYNNVFKYISKLESSRLLSILEIKKINETELAKSFVIHILLQNATDLTITQEYCIIMHLDEKNLTYSLEPVDVKNIDEVKLETNIENIEPNENNRFEYTTTITDEDVINEHVNIFKRVSVVYPEYVYNNILNKEYREKRFGDIDNFKKYIENNKENIKNINIKKYQKNTDNSEYLQYICIDQNGKYYILREKSILDCSLILDTYSIDIPEFIEKYDSASETNKVGLNANKIIEAANNQDYNYIYNKLNETFKNNNFGDVSKLEEFIKNTFYENTVMKNAQCKQEGNAYVFTMQITNQAGTEKLKDVTIIMQLLENRDFVMSFAKPLSSNVYK